MLNPPTFSPTISLGTLLIIASGVATAIVLFSKFIHAMKDLTAPIREHFVEHDVMWEDYNLRTGGHYRRNTGRGNPPEPEDWHREHGGNEDEDV